MSTRSRRKPAPQNTRDAHRRSVERWKKRRDGAQAARLRGLSGIASAPAFAVPGSYRVASFGETVSGGNHARMCRVDAVAKGGGKAVAHEQIALRLGMLLGLPVAAGAIARSPNGTVWVSLYAGRIGANGTRAPMLFAGDHPFLAAGVVVFDSWIANADRKARHILYAPGTVDPVLIDHSELSLIESHEPARYCAGSIGEHLRSVADLEAWCTRVAEIPLWMIVDACRSAVPAGISGEQADRAASLLDARRTDLARVVRAGFDGRACE